MQAKNKPSVPAGNPRAAIDSAMANIKRELSAVTKDKTAGGGKYSYNYADLNQHLQAVEPLLAKYGCSLRQPTQFVGGKNVVISAIVHTESGMEASASLGLGEQIDMQKLGAAITYARRYTLSALLSMQAEDDDAVSTLPKKTGKPAAKSVLGDF